MSSTRKTRAIRSPVVSARQSVSARGFGGGGCCERLGPLYSNPQGGGVPTGGRGVLEGGQAMARYLTQPNGNKI
jgi:hypothetical protein